MLFARIIMDHVPSPCFIIALYDQASTAFAIRSFDYQHLVRPHQRCWHSGDGLDWKLPQPVQRCFDL